MDAVDAALVLFENDQTKLIEYQQYPIDENIKNLIRSTTALSPEEKIAELNSKLGYLFAKAVKTLIQT
ncbi:MAG: anhydro-N-acetylmuramic acid kinase, partial [Gammaproteobacteria bacterium]